MLRIVQVYQVIEARWYNEPDDKEPKFVLLAQPEGPNLWTLDNATTDKRMATLRFRGEGGEKRALLEVTRIAYEMGAEIKRKQMVDAIMAATGKE